MDIYKHTVHKMEEKEDIVSNKSDEIKKHIYGHKCILQYHIYTATAWLQTILNLS